jgi:hypothetical protein
MTSHTVRSGENLSSIASLYGFRSWRVLYDDPANAALRLKRPDPGLIYPGDVVVIPEKAANSRPAQTGQTHSVVVKAPELPPAVSIRLLDEYAPHNPLAGFTVEFDNPPSGPPWAVPTLTRTTDKDGYIRKKTTMLPSGSFYIQRIADEREVPHLSYSAWGELCHIGVPCELFVPDQRAIVQAIADAHAISRRRAWGKRTPAYSAMERHWEYTTIVIHHSGNGGITDPLEIEEEHMGDKGWDDVGYHYMVRPNGSIYEGRFLAFKGSHVEAANSNKIGILVMGDFEANIWDDDDEVTAQQWTATIALVKTLKKYFTKITLLGGHKDYKPSTECPGDILYGQLDDLRTATGLGGP